MRLCAEPPRRPEQSKAAPADVAPLFMNKRGDGYCVLAGGLVVISCSNTAPEYSVAMVGEVAKSDVPMLGYTVPYAVGNTLLTLWGLVIVLLIL